ncbi:hypothetical protein DPMN_132776 [Dreissena polymorpha]|uniref:Uncharacterized protein n=1 Tax=Dreissena polymorpha TaxID=45954 RepID=A0A9D4FSA2_DREPO|nr:hypothetical protein DPMN_132776 [Dreissena polymorpha]
MFYESDCTFEELRRKVRTEEQELKSAKEPEHPKQVNVHQMDNHLKILNDLKEQMKEMEKKTNALTQERQKPNDQVNTSTWTNRGQSYRGYRGNTNFRSRGGYRTGNGRFSHGYRGNHENNGAFDNRNNNNNRTQNLN